MVTGEKQGGPKRPVTEGMWPDHSGAQRRLPPGCRPELHEQCGAMEVPRSRVRSERTGQSWGGRELGY